MRRALALAALAAACGRRAQHPVGVGDVGEVARLLFAALEAGVFERVRILLPTAVEADALAAKTDFRDMFERTSRDRRLHWEVAVYCGYVHEGCGLVVYVEAGPDVNREEFYDIHFIVTRVERGWVLSGPFYCAGLRDAADLPPLQQ